MAKPHPTDPSQGDVVNATAMIELARSIASPQSLAFLRDFEEAEADIARDKPFLSEGRIRDLAVTAAMRKRGMTPAFGG